ncbi:hypothetical protein [Specibacter sp. NPDC078692]|uniref:hypothetical protein n=1 Tax=Specibacter sp. NPDC078692 TaxID=3155818 RepID=UPI003446A365
MIRPGTVGRAGKHTETGLDPATTDIGNVIGQLLNDGYEEVLEYQFWVVIQFPSKTKAADFRLIEHAEEWLAATLDERGLGYVDGHDRGKHSGTGKIVVNVYLRAIDAELGCLAAMSALRSGRADPQRATIAYRATLSEIWTVRYERTSGKFPREFGI